MDHPNLKRQFKINVRVWLTTAIRASHEKRREEPSVQAVFAAVQTMLINEFFRFFEKSIFVARSDCILLANEESRNCKLSEIIYSTK